jgi:predicted AAA+ superfamily ATPase
MTDHSLLGHPVVGGSWEGFVIENIMSVSPSRVQPYYYGTPGGAEIDLVLEFPGGTKWAIEIKRSSVPTVSKGFYSACDDIKPDRRFVVYSGLESFSVGEGITAISLPNLMREFLKQ